MKIKAHNRYITALAKHPTKPFLVSADVDGNILLWNYLTGEQIQNIRQTDAKKEQRVYTLSFSPNANLLALTIGKGKGKKLQLLETDTWQLIKQFDYFHYHQFAWHPKGDYLALTTGKILDGNSFEEVHKFSPHNYLISSLMFSETGNILVSGGDNYDSTVAILSTNSWEIETKFPDLETDTLDFTREPSILGVDEETIYIRDEYGLYSYNRRNQSTEKLIQLPPHYPKLALSPSKKFLAFDTIERAKKIPNLEEIYKEYSWARSERAIGTRIVIRDLEIEETIHQFEGFEDWVTAILFLDNNTIAVGDWDGYLRIESFIAS